jgi:hypothetical protein
MLPETSIISPFAQLEDPRDERKRKDPLMNIITIAILGVLGGADTWVDIERYGKSKREWLGTFLDLSNGIPSHDTFGRVFRWLDKGTTVAYHVHGVALHVGNSGNIAEPSTPISSFFVRVILPQAKAAGIRVDDFTPAAMVSSLGTPTAAHLLYSKAQLGKSNRFRLVLLFEARAAVYVISGQARDERVCLAPDDLEVVTLYRYHTADFARYQVSSNLAGGKTLATTALRETTLHGEQDLVSLAKSPDGFCLTLR